MIVRPDNMLVQISQLYGIEASPKDRKQLIEPLPATSQIIGEMVLIPVVPPVGDGPGTYLIKQIR